MKPTPNSDVEKYRLQSGVMASDVTYGNNGVFVIPNLMRKKSAPLHVLASDGGGWDHVSISLPFRCPYWDEMCRVKDLFFLPTETVIQFHPSVDQYVNCHPHCLHLWRNQALEHALPPMWMVGPKGSE